MEAQYLAQRTVRGGQTVAWPPEVQVDRTHQRQQLEVADRCRSESQALTPSNRMGTEELPKGCDCPCHGAQCGENAIVRCTLRALLPSTLLTALIRGRIWNSPFSPGPLVFRDIKHSYYVSRPEWRQSEASKFAKVVRLGRIRIGSNVLCALNGNHAHVSSLPPLAVLRLEDSASTRPQGRRSVEYHR